MGSWELHKGLFPLAGAEEAVGFRLGKVNRKRGCNPGMEGGRELVREWECWQRAGRDLGAPEGFVSPCALFHGGWVA